MYIMNLGPQVHGNMSCRVTSWCLLNSYPPYIVQLISITWQWRDPVLRIKLTMWISGTVKREIQELFAPCSGESAPGATVSGFLPLSKGGQGGETTGRHVWKPQIVPRLYMGRAEALHTTPLSVWFKDITCFHSMAGPDYWSRPKLDLSLIFFIIWFTDIKASEVDKELKIRMTILVLILLAYFSVYCCIW